jgi:hypothetical protein
MPHALLQTGSTLAVSEDVGEPMSKPVELRLEGPPTDAQVAALDRLTAHTKPPVVTASWECGCKASYLLGSEQILNHALCLRHGTPENRAALDAMLISGDQLRNFMFGLTDE